MTIDGIIYLVLALASCALLAASIRIVPDGGRIVVIRLGRPCVVLKPGIRHILPGLDRIHRVSLDRIVPSWRALSEEDLDEHLLGLARSGELGSPT